MLGVLELLLGLSAAILCFYWWSVRTFSHWESRGIPYIKPLPLFGNSYESITGKLASTDVHDRNYKQMSKYPMYGCFSFRTPVLYISKPELIETILIKDFSHFYNRGLKVNEDLEPFSCNLVNLEDERWKNLRNKLTPVFTSGKLRLMEGKMMDCASDLVEYIKSRNGEPLETKDVMKRFGMSIILSTAFGLNVDTINEPNSRFLQLGGEFFQASFLRRLRLVLRMTAPNILTLLRWKAISNNSEKFFIKVIKDTIQYRESTGAEGKDFLQLLINVRKEDKSVASKIISDHNDEDEDKFLQEGGKALDNTSGSLLTDRMLIANAFAFFNAGFETTSTALSYCLIELSRNPQIQEKLFREIKDVTESNGNQLSYDSLKKMSYLQQVINETLRKWPPAPATIRICTKDYIVPGTNLLLHKGDRIQVPIYSIQHDPRYWPDPKKFDPDRFSPENKNNIVKGTFFPFGDGPRICIGMRFALLEMKMALTNILLNFEVTFNPKTKWPIGILKNSVILTPDSGLWVDFKIR